MAGVADGLGVWVTVGTPTLSGVATCCSAGADGVAVRVGSAVTVWVGTGVTSRTTGAVGIGVGVASRAAVS